MGLSRSTYYYRVKPKSLEAKKEQADLRDRIEQIVVECARYGYRRVAHQIRRGGGGGNHKRGGRGGGGGGLQSQMKRGRGMGTHRDHAGRSFSYLLTMVG